MSLAEAIGALATVPAAWGHVVIGSVDASRGVLRLHFVNPTTTEVMHRAREIVAYHLPPTLDLEVSCRGQR